MPWACALLIGLTGVGGGSARAEPKASDPVVTVAPLRGKGGAACAQALEAAMAEDVALEPWQGEGSAAGFRTWAELSSWVESEGQALGAQVVVVGTIRAKKLILEAYDTGTGALLGLTQVRTVQGKGCTPTRGGRNLLIQFVTRAQASYARRRAFAAPPDTSTVAVAPPPKAAPPPTKTAPPPPEVAPPPPPPPAPPVAAAEPPELNDEPEPDDEYAPVLQADPQRPRKRKATGAAAPAPEAPAGPVWALLDVEVGLTQRNLAFDDATGAAAGTYQVGAMFTPGVRLMAWPFVEGPRWLRPLSLEATYRGAVGFQSRPSAGAEPVPTRYLDAAAALAYRIEVPGTRFAVSPRVGANVMQFGLQTPGKGAGLDTPGVDYRSAWLGVAVDARLMATAQMRLRAAYMPLLHAGAIFASNYFPEGSGWALDVQAELTIRVLPWLVGVVSGHYTGYSLDLAGDQVTAAGAPAAASDRVTGIRLGIRLER